MLQFCNSAAAVGARCHADGGGGRCGDGGGGGGALYLPTGAQGEFGGALYGLES